MDLEAVTEQRDLKGHLWLSDRAEIIAVSWAGGIIFILSKGMSSRRSQLLLGAAHCPGYSQAGGSVMEGRGGGAGGNVMEGRQDRPPRASECLPVWCWGV